MACWMQEITSDTYILGTQEPDSHPYNLTMLGNNIAALTKINGFDFGLGGIGDASFLSTQDSLLGANAQIASPRAAAAAPVPGTTFTVEQLEAMLAAAKRTEAANAQGDRQPGQRRVAHRTVRARDRISVDVREKPNVYFIRYFSRLISNDSS